MTVQRGDAFSCNGGRSFGCVLHVNNQRGIALVVEDSGRSQMQEVPLSVAVLLVQALERQGWAA